MQLLIISIFFTISLFVTFNVFAKMDSNVKIKEDLFSTKVLKEPKSVKQGYQPININEFKDIQLNSKSDNKYVTECKTKTGRTFNEKDMGYDSCLREPELDYIQKNKSGAASTLSFSTSK